jgi:Carbohydrate binding domain/Fibronectin type III domain
MRQVMQRRGRRVVVVATGVFVCAILFSLASAAGATNALPNGDFEGTGSGSLTGWAGTHATLALASDGHSGTYAARVAYTSGSTYSVRTSPNPVTVTAGQTYTASGWVRSDAPGQPVCLKLVEVSSSNAVVGSAKTCTTTTVAWMALGPLAYKGKTAGDNLSFRVVQTSSAPGSGASFEVDDLMLTSSAGDTQPPTVPTNLTATAASGAVALSWHASTDNVGVTSYSVHRDGPAIATVGGSTLSYTDTTVAPSTTYTYTVEAFDAAGNGSGQSSPAVVDTPAGGGTTGDPVIAAAGDIACDPIDSGYNGGAGTSSLCKEMATSNLIMSMPSVAAVLALGDNQYECGGLAAYQQSFGASWGRFLSLIHPIAGNHDYTTTGTDCAPNAAGYFTYFGAAAGNAQGDYAWDIGSWHLIALNGQCAAVGGCAAGSPQANFLNAHLGSSSCTLAYWHQPFYTGGGTNSAYRYFWQTLRTAGADIVLDGHVHTYADFAKQDVSGNVDPGGIKEFIVGTGGKSLQKLSSPKNVLFWSKSYGVLFLTLHSDGYTWQFKNTAGTVLDSGNGTCNH